METLTHMLLFTAGLAFIIIAFASWLFRRRLGPFVAFTIIGGVFIFMSSFFSSGSSSDSDSSGSDSDSEPAPAPEPESAPAETPSDPTPIDTGGIWTFSLYAVVTIVGLALLTGLFFLVRYMWNRSLSHRKSMERKSEERRKADERKAEQRKRTEALWSKVLAEAEQLETEWLDYQTDFKKILDFPMMTDMGEPLVDQASRHYLDMVALREEEPPEAATPNSAFPRAVRTFKASMEAAEREAHKVKSSRFSTEEQKKIKRAKRLLAQAEGTTSEAERATAYRQAIKTLDGLVTIPKQAIAVIEEKAPRLALTMGGSDDGDLTAPSRAREASQGDEQAQSSLRERISRIREKDSLRERVSHVREKV